MKIAKQKKTYDFYYKMTEEGCYFEAATIGGQEFFEKKFGRGAVGVTFVDFHSGYKMINEAELSIEMAQYR